MSGREVSEKIDRFVDITTELEHKLFSVDKQSNALVDQTSKLSRDGKQLSNDIMLSLKALRREPDCDRRRLRELKIRFESKLLDFRELETQIAEAERENIHTLKSSVADSAPVHNNGILLQDVSLDMSSEFRLVQLEQIQSKQEALLEIERDVKELQGMFDDLNYLVEEQGEQLDMIENNITSVKVHTVQATEELVVAEKHAKKSRKKQCYMILCCLVVLLIILLPTLLTTLN